MHYGVFYHPSGTGRFGDSPQNGYTAGSFSNVGFACRRDFSFQAKSRSAALSSLTTALIGAGAGGVALAGYVAWNAWDYRRQRGRVLAEGVPVVGYIVQANNELFKPGRGSAPAQVLISFTNPKGEGLEELAYAVARLKSEAPENPLEQTVAKLVRDETFRPGTRVRLPAQFAHGAEVYSVDVWIERQLLPEGRLTKTRLNCIAIRGDKGRVYLDPRGIGT
jgi:hypothetical protein